MKEFICIKAEIMKHINRIRSSDLGRQSVVLHHLTTQFRCNINEMTETQCIETVFNYIKHLASELLAAQKQENLISFLTPNNQVSTDQ